jgi:trypsin
MAKILRLLRVLFGVLLAVGVPPATSANAAAASAPSANAAPVTEAAQPPPTVGGGEPFVVGGDRVSITDYPWAVYLTTPGGLQICGGTLIAPDKVVTAAHCTNKNSLNRLRVVAGREDKNSSEGVVASVTNVWVHPDFVSVTGGDDVSVLTLDQRLDLATIGVVKGPDAEEYTVGTDATILGWGRTNEGGEPSAYLLKANLPIISDDGCSSVYPAYNKESMVCAAEEEGDVDTCQGDSGGPLVVGDKLAGITSWGEGCARPGKAGVYTRVGNYYDLIQQQIKS